MRLDLGLTSDDFNTEHVSGITESIKALDWKKASGSPTWTYNADKAHFNAKRVEAAKLAAPYDAVSTPWTVTDPEIAGSSKVDASKKL